MGLLFLNWDTFLAAQESLQMMTTCFLLKEKSPRYHNENAENTDLQG